jgi:hypothetical protein
MNTQMEFHVKEEKVEAKLWIIIKWLIITKGYNQMVDRCETFYLVPKIIVKRTS